MIEKRKGGNGLYDIHVGYSKFMGLFTSLDRHIIPDEYLSAMSNLRRTMYGTIESVKAPQTWTTNLPAPLAPITSIQRPFTVYFDMAGACYNASGQLIAAGTGTSCGHHIVLYININASVEFNKGLINVDAGTAVPLCLVGFADADKAYSDALTVSGSRMWFTFGTNKLRGSDIGDLEAENNGEGWGAWDGPNADIMVDLSMDGYITGLFDVGNYLLIFTPAKVYKMSPFNFEAGTQKVVIYEGPNLPTFFPHLIPMFFYSSAGIEYYITGDGFFMFDGSKPVKLSNALNVRGNIGFHVGAYDDRIWFLGLEAAKMAGEQHNPIYAVNLQTGVWEQYDIIMGDTKPANVTVDTPTSLFGGQDASVVGRSDLLIGTSCGYVYQFKGGQTNTNVLPWSFSTKAFAPNSYDQPMQPVQVMIDYVEQAIQSPVTVTVQYDEDTPETIVDEVTGVAPSFTMYGAGLAHLHRGFNTPATRSCNSCTITVSGTGPCNILDIGLSFIARDGGDSNP